MRLSSGRIACTTLDANALPARSQVISTSRRLLRRCSSAKPRFLINSGYREQRNQRAAGALDACLLQIDK